MKSLKEKKKAKENNFQKINPGVGTQKAQCNPMRNSILKN
jgi:hypothetical protein